MRLVCSAYYNWTVDKVARLIAADFSNLTVSGQSCIQFHLGLLMQVPAGPPVPGMNLEGRCPLSAFLLSSLIAVATAGEGPPAIAQERMELSSAQPIDLTISKEGLPPAPKSHVAKPYSTDVFLRQAKSIPWRFGGAAAVITATGVAQWKWGTSKFHFHSEGWFGKSTANGGMDKLGHGWSSFVLTEFFTDGIDAGPGSHRSRSTTAAILAMSLMTYIEVFDGISSEHGFSPEDLTIDTYGALFSIARRTIPGLRDKLDFRLQYWPTHDTLDVLSCFPRPQCDRGGATARSVVTDYSGQYYIMALKLSGFGALRRTPVRLVEVHGGYYARGFTKEEHARGEPKRRHLFVGLGLNVSQLLLGSHPKGVGKLAANVLEYVQLPFTSVRSN